MTIQSTWVRRLGLSAAFALVGLAASPVHPAAASVKAEARTTASVPVDYNCFVTFPGGQTTVPFRLTFTATAPDKAESFRPFNVVLDSQEWTPDPRFNQEVHEVRVKYRLPANAVLLSYQLSGGSNIGTTPPKVEIDRPNRTFSLSVAGPLPANVPFDLPTVTLRLLAGASGVAVTATGGTSVTDPSWNWTRTDLAGDQRPFDCNPAQPVVFTRTAIERGR